MLFEIDKESQRTSFSYFGDANCDRAFLNSLLSSWRNNYDIKNFKEIIFFHDVVRANDDAMNHTFLRCVTSSSCKTWKSQSSLRTNLSRSFKTKKYWKQMTLELVSTQIVTHSHFHVWFFHVWMHAVLNSIKLGQWHENTKNWRYWMVKEVQVCKWPNRAFHYYVDQPNKTFRERFKSVDV